MVLGSIFWKPSLNMIIIYKELIILTSYILSSFGGKFAGGEREIEGSGQTGGTGTLMVFKLYSSAVTLRPVSPRPEPAI